MLVETDLSMAGYRGAAVPPMQKRTIEALQALPGVKSVGLIDRLPLYYGANSTNVFTDKTTDFRPANVTAEADLQSIPRILRCCPDAFAGRQGFHLA
jgi:hypothetical protein